MIQFFVVLFSSSSRIAAGIPQSLQGLGYALDEPGFDSRQGQDTLLFSKMPRLALGPIQLPIQGVQVFFPGDKSAAAPS